MYLQLRLICIYVDRFITFYVKIYDENAEIIFTNIKVIDTKALLDKSGFTLYPIL